MQRCGGMNNGSGEKGRGVSKALSIKIIPLQP